MQDRFNPKVTTFQAVKMAAGHIALWAFGVVAVIRILNAIAY